MRIKQSSWRYQTLEYRRTTSSSRASLEKVRREFDHKKYFHHKRVKNTHRFCSSLRGTSYHPQLPKGQPVFGFQVWFLALVLDFWQFFPAEFNRFRKRESIYLQMVMVSLMNLSVKIVSNICLIPAIRQVRFLVVNIREGKLGTYTLERVAVGAHLPNPWLLGPAKRRDDRSDYCLDCSFLP